MSAHIFERLISGIDLSVAAPSDTVDTKHTLFCLHGIGGDKTSFKPQMAGLSETHPVIAWSMPGYGRSERIDSVSFEALARTLKQVLDELAIEHPVLVGHSIGGMIAQEFAHRYPGRAEALVLMATTSAFGGRDPTFSTDFLKARLQPLENGMSMAAMSAEAIPAIVGKGTAPEVVDAAVQTLSSIDSEAYRSVLQCLVSFDRRAEFSDLACPLCLIAGEADTNAPARTMQKMAALANRSEYHELPGAGHLVNLERGDETNAIIRTFIDQLERS